MKRCFLIIPLVVNMIKLICNQLHFTVSFSGQTFFYIRVFVYFRVRRNVRPAATSTFEALSKPHRKRVWAVYFYPKARGNWCDWELGSHFSTTFHRGYPTW